jgi:hypothetical protein
VIAQVPLDLSRDRGDGEGRELVTAFWIEALDRVEEPDRPNLHEVVALRAVDAVPVRERLDEGQVKLYEPLAGPLVAVRLVGEQELPGGRLSLGSCQLSRPITPSGADDG